MEFTVLNGSELPSTRDAVKLIAVFDPGDARPGSCCINQSIDHGTHHFVNKAKAGAE
jgi:hypothetical protein